MTIEIKNIQPGVCVVSVDDLTAFNAADQTPILLNTLRDNKMLEIDLSGVNQMDSVGLKTLLLLRRTASRTNKVVQFVSHSKSSKDFINRFHLADYFDAA